MKIDRRSLERDCSCILSNGNHEHLEIWLPMLCISAVVTLNLRSSLSLCLILAFETQASSKRRQLRDLDPILHLQILFAGSL